MHRLATAIFLGSMAVAVAGSNRIEFSRENRKILAPDRGEFLLHV
jgi:hypothetical protein